ncbi:MAG: hypothetical protein KDN22_34215, partial [Verrucomicrobiae bacterium]|nr:hypothetical protein [Verrucomicrobiae bacterium]
YDSYTHHQREEGHLSKSIRQVYASLWNLRAFEERDFYRIDHFAAAMGVLLHRNFEAEDANGVAVSKNILFGADDEPSSGIYYVNAQFGENLVTNPEGNAIPEQSLISTSNEPIYLSYSNLEGGRERVLSSAQSKDLANKLEQIHEHFKLLHSADEDFAIEIEFKITAENELAIKQARPWLN